MSGLTLWLLLGVLLLPTCGALVARALAHRGGGRAVTLIGGLGFAGAVACLLALQWRPIDAATLGPLNIFLPSSDVIVAQDSFVEIPTIAPTRIVAPTRTPTVARTSTPTVVITTPTATSEPSPTTPPPPTEIPPTEAPAPTEAPPPPTEAPPPPTEAPVAGPQRYVVESGDTLRSIAERFNVSVGAILRYNGLSEEDGDNLRPGQELLIPPQ